MEARKIGREKGRKERKECRRDFTFTKSIALLI